MDVPLVRSSMVVPLETAQAREPVPTGAVRLRRAEPWTVVEVVGELDVGMLPLLPTLPAGHARLVAFELSGVTFMDAAGLGALISSRAQARREDGDVRLVAPSGPVRRVLELTGESEGFRIFDALEEALTAPPHGETILRHVTSAVAQR